METPLNKKGQKIFEELQAEQAAAENRPRPPAPTVDPAILERQRAQSTIIPDGRTGRAYTLLKNVVPDESQPRKAKNIDPAEILQLADSIKNGEQIQPIVVDWWPELQKWKIIVGERRWLAVQAAGIDRIACQFKMEKMEPVARKLMQGVENIHRTNLTDLERAEYFREMIQLTGWTQTQLAKEMNVSQPTVSKALALLGETEQLFTVNNPPEGVDREEVAATIKQKKRKGRKRKAKRKPTKSRRFPIEPGVDLIIESEQPYTDEDFCRFVRLLVERYLPPDQQGRVAA